MRLAVYTDLVYKRDADGWSCDQPFVRFVAELPEPITEVVLLGRLDPTPGRGTCAIPAGVRVVELPYYPRITHLRSMARALRQTLRIASDALKETDAAWVFGPHPMPFAVALLVRRRRVPLALGVRQDYPSYIANRLPSRAWSWAIPLAHLLERGFRRLASSTPTVVVGDVLERRYSSAGGPVLATGFSLVGRAEAVDREEALRRAGEYPTRILTVGRIASEKNPLLLVDVVAALRRSRPDWHLTVVGDGPLRGALEQRIVERGQEDAIEVLGVVENGPALWSCYQAADLFLHVSLTEGVPQVLFEAGAAGLPIVATDVGGVSAATGAGSAALLVPPNDAAAAATAIERVASDDQLRHDLVSAALANAEAESMEVHQARVVAFLVDRLS